VDRARAGAALIAGALGVGAALPAALRTGLLPDRYLEGGLPALGLLLAIAWPAGRAPRAGPLVALGLGMIWASAHAWTARAWIAGDEGFWVYAISRQAHPHALAGLARVRADAGDLDGAAELAARAATGSPPDPQGCWTAARLQLQRGAPAEAARIGAAARGAGCPPDPELVAPWALGLALTGDWVAAEALAGSPGPDPTGERVVVVVAAEARRGARARWLAEGAPEGLAALAGQLLTLAGEPPPPGGPQGAWAADDPDVRAARRTATHASPTPAASTPAPATKGASGATPW
jgi:hypothetical protein